MLSNYIRLGRGRTCFTPRTIASPAHRFLPRTLGNGRRSLDQGSSASAVAMILSRRRYSPQALVLPRNVVTSMRCAAVDGGLGCDGCRATGCPPVDWSVACPLRWQGTVSPCRATYSRLYIDPTYRLMVLQKLAEARPAWVAARTT